MQIWSVPTRPDSKQPVHYLADRRDAVPVESFINSVDSFMDLIMERLDTVNLEARDLRNLWEEIKAERYDAELAKFRRIEAMLGFDPDELSSEVVERFVDLGATIGSSVVGEIASACSSDDPMRELSKITQLVEMKGIYGKFSLPGVKAQKQRPNHQPPWVQGQQLAHAVRDSIGLNGQAISDSELSSLAEIIPESLAVSETPGVERPPVGIAVRQDSDRVKLVLRKRNRVGRRFELARLLCDHMLSEPNDKWLPATDTKTIRQKWQRAFAAEFLCPIDSLLARLDDDFSDDAVEAAAEHFGVSERTVTSQLVNHGLLSTIALEDKIVAGKFPYLI